MTGVNKVILIGNLGKDPEIKYLENNLVVAKFPLATSETWKDKSTGEKKDQTEWHNIVLWRGLAEIAEKYLHKGDKVYIEGKLKTRSWEDKDGSKRFITEVVTENMTMLSTKRDGGNPVSETETETEVVKEPEVALATEEKTDDLPF